MTRRYRFIADPGHGWLEVPVAELIALGIADRITQYSYMTGDSHIGCPGMAYLEEDCDAHLFVCAKHVIGERAPADREYQDPTFVRDLPRYRQPSRGTVADSQDAREFYEQAQS